MSVTTKAAIIYMKIYLAYEEHVYNTKDPLNTTFQWQMPCNATLKGKRRQYDIIHSFGYWTNVQIYNIQNTE